MIFWKEHYILRLILILIFFAAGLAFLVSGWKMSGELTGLFLMLAGLAALLAALFIYNKPFEAGRKRTSASLLRAYASEGGSSK